MLDEVFRNEIHTPETLGVTPRYVIQHNAISRSAHNLSATAKKLTAMAMALLPPDLSSRTISFTFNDFCKAMGTSIGGESFKLFKDAATECMQCVITVETNELVKGKRKWERYTWFTHSSFDEETGFCTMTFSDQIVASLTELKRLYAKINLKDLGRLQSRYAIRLYEMAESYESLKGKDGNKNQAWYFERSLSELRFLLGVPDNAYRETRDFRRKVIEEPIKEINAAGVGVAITPDSIKQGRKLTGIRFDCKQTPHTTVQNRQRRKKAAAETQPECPSTALPEANPKTATWKEEKVLEHLQELHPTEFARLYETALAESAHLPFPLGAKEIAAVGAAQQKLKEKYGIEK
jgi:plasmid replication initiation protein